MTLSPKGDFTDVFVNSPFFDPKTGSILTLLGKKELLANIDKFSESELLFSPKSNYVPSLRTPQI